LKEKRGYIMDYNNFTYHEQDLRIKHLENTVKDIREAFIVESYNWKNDIELKFKKIVKSVGHYEYENMRKESYKLLEQRAGVLLERRLDNKRLRMFKKGADRGTLEQISKFDIIAEDKKLREIYGKIISEFVINYIV
jgi:hypothetical protein